MEGENVTIFIEQNLRQMAQFDLECSIHRIPRQLLDVNYNAYTPKVISIGPFHHNQQSLGATKVLKFRFFNSFRYRIENMSIQNIVENVQNLGERARKYYSEPINMNNEEFVKMLVLDGCFVVEFMIMNPSNGRIFPENHNQVHSSFYKAIELNIKQDMMMLENQLPLFVLEELFNLIRSNTPFIEVVHTFLMDNSMFEITAVRPSNNQMPYHLVNFLSDYFVRTENINGEHSTKILPPNATQLSDANVVFTNNEREIDNDTCTLMDISFKNGILNFRRPLFINDKFETVARNLLAYAQFTGEENVNNRGNVVHYFEFLHELITTEKDVNLLRNGGIIISDGSDKEISQMFNNIFKNINGHGTNCFHKIAEDLNKHCDRRWNRSMASLKRDYFYTPWAHVSFWAATFLLVFTILQTVFTIISTFK